MKNTQSKLSKIMPKIIIVYICIMVFLIAYCYQNTQNNNKLSFSQQLSSKTIDTLNSLLKTKYFRIIRINLNQQCPIKFMNKLCKSKSCTVCRCDEKDIPNAWIKTDKVKSVNAKLDVWQKQRQNLQKSWVWHVQDQQNDVGQYFDVDTNVQSFTSYNGSYIWKLIYEQNCFQGVNHFDKMCQQQKTLYRLISGLHTSISSHLSNLYRNITTAVQWADTSNKYQRRVLSHPQRISNLLFLYNILIKSIKKIQPYLQQQKISSDNITQDLKATNLLKQFLNITNDIYNKHNYNQQQLILNIDNPKVQQYQKYIHNISRILNCVQCQKCRLFGKMQTYGVGTAIKILLGYQQPYKRNQLVALFNTLNKITISTNNYFKKVQKKDNKWLILQIYGSILTVILILLYIISKIDIENKSKKLFIHIFPKKYEKICN